MNRPPSNEKKMDFGFRLFHFAGRNEFHFFRLINAFLASLVACCCEKNLEIVRKNCFADSGCDYSIDYDALQTAVQSLNIMRYRYFTVQ